MYQIYTEGIKRPGSMASHYNERDLLSMSPTPPTHLSFLINSKIGDDVLHLFSPYSRAASEFAGELGLGSQSRDCKFAHIAQERAHKSQC